MLNNNKEKDENNLTIKLAGRLDTTTAPEMEEELKKSLDGVTTLAIDCTELEYISSAGLRVLLSAQKIMNKQGNMIIRNASDEIKEIFDITGFSDILTIQ
jgi:anti-sigma B factor antagonist